MKNVYLASVNPMHFSHWNTWKDAEDLLNEKVFLCICQNDLKGHGIFSLEERAEIAHRFYGMPKERIVVLNEKQKIINAIKNAKYVIRGIRSEKDIIEVRKLVEHYGVNEDFKKFLPISVPESMREISSSHLIQQVKDNNYKVEDNWVPYKLILLIKEKLNL